MHNGDADMMDVDMEAVPTLDTVTAKNTLSTLFLRTRRSVGSDASKPRTMKRLPQGARDMSVADVIQSGLLLQEDQDNDDLSSMLTWKDIPALRMRLLQFAENYRPAYYGKSPYISPPFVVLILQYELFLTQLFTMKLQERGQRGAGTLQDADSWARIQNWWTMTLTVKPSGRKMRKVKSASLTMTMMMPTNFAVSKKKR